jgi:hypothetical protein
VTGGVPVVDVAGGGEGDRALLYRRLGEELDARGPGGDDADQPLASRRG